MQDLYKRGFTGKLISEVNDIIIPIAKYSNIIRIMLVISLFIIGAYITYVTPSSVKLPEGYVNSDSIKPRRSSNQEGFENDGSDESNESSGIGMDTLNNQRCPNILIQHGTEIFLYNSKVAKVPGVNPIRFKSLEDYSEFMEWLHGRGIRCPILFLQYSYDAQGNPVYKIRPSPLDLQGGLSPNVPYSPAPAALVQMMDASRDNPPFNNDMYAGFDPLNFNMGDHTPLDAAFREKELTMKYSDNPMDANWGGSRYSEAVVNSGVYADRTRPDSKSNSSALLPMNMASAPNIRYSSARYASDAVSTGQGNEKKWGRPEPILPSTM
jgi:hypothetical protein